MSVWADFGCLGEGGQIHTQLYTHTYTHTQAEHKDTYIPHTYTYKHELRHINQPSLEVTEATVSPYAKTDARY